MSYDAVRAQLVRSRQHAEGSSEEFRSLVDAIEYLTDAVETDLTQIKGALSHLARLIEHDGNA